MCLQGLLAEVPVDRVADKDYGIEDMLERCYHNTRYTGNQESVILDGAVHMLSSLQAMSTHLTHAAGPGAEWLCHFLLLQSWSLSGTQPASLATTSMPSEVAPFASALAQHSVR